MTLRSATTDDLPAIADIYHHYVRHSTCTFETDPRPAEKWAEWFHEHGETLPVIVAEEGGAVLGWASLSRWNTRCAYRFSVEDSVYVHAGAHRRGIGRALLAELIQRAGALGLRSLVAQIADHQAASETLHEQFGFRRVGTLEAIGNKFDRWIDVTIWQLRLPGRP